MVRARTAFLDAGFYDALRDAVTKEVLAHAEKGVTLLDAGCGEGFYTAHIRRALLDADKEIGSVFLHVFVDRYLVVAEYVIKPFTKPNSRIKG